MAQAPYSDGVANVAPDARPPDAYQHIQATPASFGGLIAQGAEKLGQGAEKAAENTFDIAQFHDKINADDQVNAWITQKDVRMRGDPNKTTIGPNGQPVPDLGYMGLQGRAAADQREATLKGLEEDRLAIRKNLNSPYAQLLYDEQTRRMYSTAVDAIGQHADQQWTHWAGGVNQAGAGHAMTGFLSSLDSPDEMAHHASDYINFKVQSAQVQFGDDPQIKAQVIAGAKQDLLENQVQAIGVHDPDRALRVLDKNRDIAGAKYDNIYNGLRQRAEKQAGDQVGTDALRGTYQTVPGPAQVQPVLDQAGARYGISGSYLTKTWQIEASASFNPPNSSTGARGPFQFTKGTAERYNLANPNDFQQSAAAAAHYAADNRAALAPTLHRDPTDAELYLAHQQGAAGATKLLLSPNARAGDLVGDQAIRVNGGNPDAPASEFVSMWTQRFNGAGAAASQSRKAAAYQNVAANPDISEGVRDHAIQRINRDVAMQMQAEEQTQQQLKLQDIAGANEYTTAILTGKPFDMNAMANDPRLLPSTKRELANFAENKGMVDDPMSYGSKYADTYSRILASAASPDRVTSVSQILSLGAPGGGLTAKGVDRLTKVYAEIHNQKLGEHDPVAINTAKAALLKSAEEKMARNQLIPGMGPVAMNIKGQRVFNSKFVPMFEAAYEQWTKNDKNPWEFLTAENTDKMIDSVYPKSQRDKDSLEGVGEGSQQGPAQAEPVPPAPHGVNADAWTHLMGAPPVAKSGNTMHKADWAGVLQMLVDKPTPENIKLFNESKFGAAGFRGEELLGQLSDTKTSPQDAASRALHAYVEGVKHRGELPRTQAWP